jgi:hypothetical protein
VVLGIGSGWLEISVLRDSTTLLKVRSAGEGDPSRAVIWAPRTAPVFFDLAFRYIQSGRHLFLALRKEAP